RGLHDCRALLVEALGDVPRAVLTSHGVNAVACSGMVLDMLRAVYGEDGASLDGLPVKSTGCQCGTDAGCQSV
ncbi:MAG TPA: nitrogen fixation protein NifB, partial [Nitratidesulfovibrio sp.]|nr:nitrogen fixation protein NifB [Nitratidesulfovibrio sp.]